ncbi:MAG: leucine--tRNA ligase [Bacteroidota bacterium]
MEYNFKEIEKKWQQYWAKNKTFVAVNPSPPEKAGVRPKFYVLDMFPYPSGAGLHVGHPLGYIASDIYARYKRLKGFNVLHPMGFDAFGLPAEQYAIQTGQHPAITTEQNISRYREQLDNLGLSFDWDREVRTSDPAYYKWTQWIFLKLFNSWYNEETGKTEPLNTLEEKFKSQKLKVKSETANKNWSDLNEKERSDVLMDYRLAYLSEAYVNWCPALGTVLANDEVKDGVSERGGYPVEKKKMKQWSMRITAFADRLLNDLEGIDWSESIKEQQRNWIGKSVGVELKFRLIPSPSPMKKGTNSVSAHEKYKYETAEKSFWPLLKLYSKENRKNLTDAEKIIWEAVRDSKLGYKIRRQHPINIFIADFVCLDKRLVIEIDGDIHDHQKEYDEERTLLLNGEGFSIIRFTNNEAINHTEEVIQKIRNELSAGASPFPSETGLGDEACIDIFTTRPDTIFGVSYMTLAPEHELVDKITTDSQRAAVQNYILETKNRSDRERMAEVKRISGVFTGAYAIHPFTGKQIPVWVGDYVLAGYGTGAVMAVPAHDSRDYAFATHFNLPKPQVIQPKTEWDFSTSSYDEKEGTCINSDFLNGLHVKDAIKKAIDEIEKRGLGTRQINYRLRDAVFGRQRYWGEPIPIYYENGIPKAVDEKDLPVILPEVDKYLPTEDGEPPLARANNWKYRPHPQTPSKEEGSSFPLETTTMPGWAGSSWYYLRYMDAHNEKEFVSKDAVQYWQDVDLYIGGSEHATGHLLYVRFWTKALYDLGLIPVIEPAKKLINQGMIQGRSNFVYRIKDTNKFVSKNLKANYDTNTSNVDVNIVEDDVLDLDKFRQWREENANAEFILEDGKYICGAEVEKMSKSKWNVVNPDDMIEKYGADCLRLYEMFLGPLELSKPWNTNGISGTSNFIRKLWRLYHQKHVGNKQLAVGNEQPIRSEDINQAPLHFSKFHVSDEAPSKKELKSLHKLIKKVTDDIERFSFNTSVSNFMICVNELTDLKCDKRAILDTLAILVSPYAPHVAEELWNLLGHSESVTYAGWPEFKEEFLAEDSFAYPISINGKTKLNLEISLALNKDEIEKEVMSSEEVKKFFHGQLPKKVIVVPGRIVNIVV